MSIFTDRRPTWDALLLASFDRGDASDRGYGANVGTLANGATVATRTLSLDGTNDMATFPDSATLDALQKFTVMAWVKPVSPGSSSRAVAGRYLTSGTNRSWGLGWRYDIAGTPIQLLLFGAGDLSQVVDYRAATTLPTSGWHHTAVTWDASRSAGTRAQFWLDGASVAVSSVPNDGAYTPFDTGLVTTIGSWGAVASPSAPWAGNIDDVRIYSRAMTSAEIIEIYNSTSGVTRP